MTKKQRKCIGCNEYKPQENMIKLTKEHASGGIYINPDCKTFGRSAYLCYNQNCIETAFKKNKLKRALKTNANIEKADVISILKNG